MRRQPASSGTNRGIPPRRTRTGRPSAKAEQQLGATKVARPQPARRRRDSGSRESALSMTSRGLLTTAERSRRMAGIRQSGTRPELAVRETLAKLGVRYRLNVKTLPGRPDMANATRKIAVYVHGCFWHRHEGCRRTTTPTRNRDFWISKFDANQSRDRRAAEALRAMGFTVCVIWECETEDKAQLMKKLRECLKIDNSAPCRRRGFRRSS